MQDFVQHHQFEDLGHTAMDAGELHVAALLLHFGVDSHQHAQPDAGDKLQVFAIEDHFLMAIRDTVLQHAVDVVGARYVQPPR